MSARRRAVVAAFAALALGRESTRAQVWTPVGTPAEASLVRDIGVAPTPNRTLYVAAVNNLGIVSRLYGGIFRKTVGGPFERVVTQSAVTSLSVDPATPSTVYAASSGSLLQTNDGGTTWAIPPGSPPASAVLASPDGTLFAGSASGVFRRVAGSGVWERSDAAFSPVRLAVDPRSPSTIYAAASQESPPALNGGGLFRSTDDGAHFLPIGSAEIGADAAAVAVDPISSGTVYVAAGTRVLRSVGGGTHWFDRSAALPGTRVLSLAIDPRRPWILYAGTRGSGVFRTVDGGATWSSFNPGLPTSGFGTQDIYALTIDPASLTLYGGTDGSGVYAIETGALGTGCVSGATTLCLGDGRFSVSVDFDSPFGRGSGQAVPLSINGGAFWFLSANNIEIVVKVLDGRPVNGHYWVFLGSLSDLEYAVTVTDTASGMSRSYANPRGQLAANADTAAF